MAKPLRLCFYMRVPEQKDAEFEADVKLAKELGYWGIEPEVRDPNTVDAAYLEETIRGAGLQMSHIATGPGYVVDGLCLTDPGSAGRAAAIERLEGQIALGQKWGLGIIIGSMRGKVANEDQREQTLDWLIDGLRTLSKGLAPDQRIIVEAINRYETNICNTAAETVALLERGGLNGVAALLDTFHMNIEEKTLSQALRDTGARLGHVHFSDSNRCATGTGHIDYAEMNETLNEIGYDKCVTVEVLKKPDLQTAMKISIEHLRSVGIEVAE